MKQTPLHYYHVQHAKMIDFAGYDMPIWYTSISDEHLSVRNRVGMFDVSHMGRLTISGEGRDELVETLVPTLSSSHAVGRSYYTLMLNSGGGIIDDLIIVKRPNDYLLVVNAANREKDLAHISQLSTGYHVVVEDITDNTAMIAVQGPESIQALQPLTRTNLSELGRFTHVATDIGSCSATITRTGYTGEDGFEVILHDLTPGNDSALRVWSDLERRAKPCGLGARDSLRIEAGLPLYGFDIDETTNPIEAELRWVISKEKSGYIGSESIERFLSAPPFRLRRGIVLGERIPRHGFEVTDATGRHIGDVTSGTFSPLLKRGLAIAYLELAHSRTGQPVRVVVRESPVEGTVVKPPFYDEKSYGWKRVNQHPI